MPFGRHGPGAVAFREHGREKWMFNSIPGVPECLYKWHKDVPLTTWKTPSDACNRVTVVPKDFRSPRIICIEPKELQFAQQGLMQILYDLVAGHPLTRNEISFRDQKKSQRLCRRYDLATIDLKDASDRVSLSLCRLLFTKEVFHLLTRYRSRESLTEFGRTRTECFASMGNALCFPVETLVFWAIARACIPENVHRPVRCFGDDLIVPIEYAHRIVDVLETCGFKVNQEKTCINTFVRESCGAWYFNGFDVSCIRLKNRSVTSLLTWISLGAECKLLFEAGMTLTAYSILEVLDEYEPIPWGFLGYPPKRPSWPANTRLQARLNKSLNRVEVKVPVPFVGSGGISLPGYHGLYAWLVGNDTRPVTSAGTVKVKKRWTATEVESWIVVD